MSTQSVFLFLLLFAVVTISSSPVHSDDLVRKKWLREYAVAGNLHNNGLYSRAIKYWERIIRDCPDEGLVGKSMYYVAVCNFHERELAKSQKAVEQLLTRYPKTKLRQKALLLSAATYIEQKEIRKAEAALALVQKEFPDAKGLAERVRRREYLVPANQIDRTPVAVQVSARPVDVDGIKKNIGRYLEILELAQTRDVDLKVIQAVEEFMIQDILLLPFELSFSDKRKGFPTTVTKYEESGPINLKYYFENNAKRLKKHPNYKTVIDRIRKWNE